MTMEEFHKWYIREVKPQPTHRMRRGKLVEIPEEWRGKVTHKQTIRKRASKQGQGPSYKCKAQR